MSSLCKSVQKGIRSQDLFGVPVQLHYQGQKKFNTVLGGCVSIIIALIFISGCIYQLHHLITAPNYQSYPPQNNFDSTPIEIRTRSQGTVAVRLGDFSGEVDAHFRVQFLTLNTTSGGLAFIHGVRCKDFYAKEIQAEANGTSKSDFYTKNFDEPYHNWVCPDVEKLTLAKDAPFRAQITQCGQAAYDTYAADVPCSGGIDTLPEKFYVDFKIIQSRFDPQIYSGNQTLQMWSEEHRAIVILKSGRQIINTYATLETNIIRSHFLWYWQQVTVENVLISITNFFNEATSTFTVDYFAELKLSSSVQSNIKSYYRVYLIDFLANVGGLLTSVLGGAAFAMSGNQWFVQSQSMLKTLYGLQDSQSSDSIRRHRRNQSSDEAKEAFENHVNARREFPINYFSYLVYSTVIGLWCCFKHCCSGQASCMPRINKYRKFQLALKRLSREQDLQHLIEMNRVSRILHKGTFLARQRSALSTYSRKFVITDKDLVRDAYQANQAAMPDSREASERRALAVLNGFEPGDSEQDRRVFFEVTKMRLDQNEFQKQESSDDEGFDSDSDDDVPVYDQWSAETKRLSTRLNQSAAP